MSSPSAPAAPAPVVVQNPVEALQNPEQYSNNANMSAANNTAGANQRTSLRIDPAGSSATGLAV